MTTMEERVRHQKTTTRNKYVSFSKEQENLEIHIIPTSHFIPLGSTPTEVESERK